MTNGVDYWRDLYDPFRRWARGHRLVPAHVWLCDSGGNLGPGWYILAGVHSAIPGRHAASPLGRWVFCKCDNRLADRSEPFSLCFSRFYTGRILRRRLFVARQNFSVARRHSSNVITGGRAADHRGADDRVADPLLLWRDRFRWYPDRLKPDDGNCQS